MRGFSLVELAIVLVILGLLTGGILAGQSLIRAAELRSVVSDYQRYQSATHSFRDKYMALPGDMNNATRFWLRQTNDSWCVTNSSAAVGTPGTCDGNGNGVIGGGPAASQSGERFQFWRQLAHAGMIEGSYTGLAGAGGNQHATPSANVPTGKMSNSGWYVSYLESFTGNSSTLALDYGNYLFMGAANSTTWPAGAVLRPEEMWNIDVKMDDGKIAAGKIVSFWWDDCGTGTASTDLNAEYDVRSTNIACTPIMRHAF